jgi:hypothetical protein
MANRRLRNEIFEMVRDLRALGPLDEKAVREFRTLADQGVRIVRAPESLLTSSVLPPNRVTSVILKPEEDVIWSWTSTADGSYVSGYRIVKRKAKLRSR